MNVPEKLFKALEKIQYEPNFELFEYKGYKCIIQRLMHPQIFMGNLNGYVFVPPTHNLYGRSADYLDVEVHGGLTWASKAEKLFSKIPAVKDMWVFGFDTGHAFDMMPFLHISMLMFTDIKSNINKIVESSEYRTWKYMKQECKNVVNQIKEKFE